MAKRRQQVANASALVRRVLRREMTSFFIKLMTEEPGWPAVSRQALIDALADSLLDVGRQSDSGAAMIQTLAYELLERADLEVAGAPRFSS